MRHAFLTARWEHLVMLNYEVLPASLLPLVPRGTDLDLWDGHALVSLVGFLFADTRVRGVPIPGHRNFEEVNLRFYVRRPMPSGPDRRAVVFVRELVPRFAIAAMARLLYNEPYLSVPMRHRTSVAPQGGTIEYAWRFGGSAFSVGATVVGSPEPQTPGTEAEFITEHYWGYTRQRDGGTIEYEVEHPKWRVWSSPRAVFTGPAALCYGDTYGAALASGPRSAFVAEGSAVAVYPGRRIV